MIHALILSAIASVSSYLPSPTYVLEETTIVVSASEIPEAELVDFRVCLHVPGEDAPRECGLFRGETITDALHAGKAYYGDAARAVGGIVTAEVSK